MPSKTASMRSDARSCSLILTNGGTDETRPTCLRCQNDGLSCTGYPEHPPFINSTPASWPPKISRMTQHTTLSLPPLPSLITIDDDHFRAYLKNEIQSGDSVIDKRWPGFTALSLPDSLTRQCITSFAAALYGRRRSSERARNEGMRLYAKSLSELNTNLSQLEGSTAGQTTLSIVILAVCEVS